MELIPVLDLARGVAVHARGGGRRNEYLPVQSVLAPGTHGDALALIAAYRTALGAKTCYVADLDAIEGGRPQRALVSRLATEFGAPLMVDAGLQCPANEIELSASGTSRVIIGLESLPTFTPLRSALLALGPDQVTFSLDVRGGQPIMQGMIAAEMGGAPTAADIARKVTAMGVDHIIVLDLARVGRNHGTDARLMATVRAAAPDACLITGGGIRTWSDLESLADAGADAALVATALHDGRLGSRANALLDERR